jgi:Protein of unknown function (DUF3093)
MRLYRERLVAPVSWWISGVVCVALFGTTLWAGFSLLAGLAVYVGLAAILIAALVSWGSATIEVTRSELAAGRHRIPLSEVGEVTALDSAQSRAIRGPRADPAAFLLIRPYLPESVYVAVKGRPAGQPYLLLGTRKPARLAEVIEQARRGAGESAAWEDAGSEATL